MQITEMRPVVPEWYNDVYATNKLGFVWMAFDGLPMRGHPEYDAGKIRVRQLMSPEQMKNQSWIDHFEANNGSEADGSEPLAYTYCSSGCSAAMVPDLVNDELTVEIMRIVREQCENVPHDIGEKLAQVVRSHFANALG